MGLSRKLSEMGRKARRWWPARGAKPPQGRSRVLRIEQMEPRRLLAFSVVPIHLGMVYLEDASGDDSSGDVFEVTWSGGQPGTQLTQIVIDTDKDGGGLSAGDCFFDTAPGGRGVYGWAPFTILENQGIDAVHASVADGGTRLVLTFVGFDPGDRLTFSIDVDEAIPDNSKAEGAEFADSILTATFTAPHYYDVTTSDVFVDFYDAKLAASGLDLPPDSYVPPAAESLADYTAGGFLQAAQTPLPITIRGNVFEDADMDNVFDPGEQGLAGVQLSLYRMEEGQYVDTGLRATTDALGRYEFTATPESPLHPGAYRIVQTQPDGYLSVGASAGTVGGAVRGTVENPNVITEIQLVGGEDSVKNDFGEVRPASVSGRVHAELNGDCVWQPGEPLLAGVTIHLLDAQGNIVATTQTDASGEYRFEGLLPGKYGVMEIQPAGYFDGPDHPGSAGGVAVPPDSILDVRLGSGVQAVRYDFCEALPNSISGRVHVDRNGNYTYDPGEPLLAGVTIELLDAQNNVLRTTKTDANGEYRFDDLAPGLYTVREIQPAGYDDGPDHVGSASGTLLAPDSITGIQLKSAVHAVRYDFCELERMAVSGYVYVDDNNNGVKETGEPPIAGVTLRLLDAQGHTLRTTTTDAAGFYRFGDLPAGTYTVVQVQPDGYLDGRDAAGTLGGTAVNPGDRIIGITGRPGDEGRNYNFGELLPASLSGYVFQDGPVIRLLPGEALPAAESVRDGRRTSDDTPLAGVTIELLRDGRVVATARTDSRGYYEFNMLLPGVYTLRQLQPAGYLDGIDTAGTLGGTADSRADVIRGIVVGRGQAGREYNFSEIAVRTDYLPPPPEPPDKPFLPPPGPQPARTDLATVFPGQPFVLPASDISGPGGTGPAGVGAEFAWHLSVINGGRPRADHEAPALAGDGASFTLVSSAAWARTDLDQSRWVLGDGAAGAPLEAFFGREGAVPVTGDFNGDGKTNLGVFIDGEWFLDLNGNGIWDEGDAWIKLGAKGDVPVTGDWDGDGKTDIGIYGRQWPRDMMAASLDPGLPDAQNSLATAPKNLPPAPEEATSGERLLRRTAQGKLRSDLIDHVFLYGDGAFRPVAGDFNGDGVATIGIFRNGVWRLDANGNGRLDDEDLELVFGQAGDLPVVGDFNGDGIDNVGVYRDGLWILDSDGDGRLTERDKTVRTPQGTPLTGDWDGDGVDEPAVYQPGVRRARGT